MTFDPYTEVSLLKIRVDHLENEMKTVRARLWWVAGAVATAVLNTVVGWIG